MKNLVLTCVLFLLAGCASTTPAPTPTVVPIDVKSFVRIAAPDKPCGTQAGYAVFVGTVTNTSTNITLQAVLLRGSIFDPNGKALNTNVGLIDSDKIAPGQTSTFKILVPDPNGTANRFDSKCKIEFSNARVSP